MPQLDDFIGHWRIDRRIEDARARRTGTFDGHALFVDDGAGLLYSERGTLRLPGQPAMEATRRYLWRAAPGEIRVLYEDGRFFHRIATSARVSQDWHDCLPDTYEVTYNFTRWPLWRMIWKVTGPRKSYVSISDFARA